MVKNPPANAGDTRDVGSIPGLGRSPGEGHGNPLQYSCLENPMDRGPWQATVHGRQESATTEHMCTKPCDLGHMRLHKGQSEPLAHRMIVLTGLPRWR